MSDLPVIKSIKDDKLMNLLNLFCFGTYYDFISNPARLPTLNEQQLRKLRQLTIISESYQNRQLSYEELRIKLGLKDIHELEELVTDLIYLEAIRAKIDQRNNVLIIEHSIGRDVRIDEIIFLIGTKYNVSSAFKLKKLSDDLKAWRSRVQQVIGEVRLDIQKADHYKSQHEAHKVNIESTLASHKSNFLQQRLKIDVRSFLYVSPFSLSL
ncbi:COP9 signalosome complex subunit 7a [Cichlidogyrus casuarinus]|uniref:COP9 signalosome complex subunit 7a n=1 Tax=Cichlidogyrus casuarinus TaxID=1844966 RepID=A0ABD2Q1I9_9PLAT